MIRTMISISVVCLLASLVPQFAAAQETKLSDLRADGEGKTNRACFRKAEARALDGAWQNALRSQGIQPQFGKCIRSVDEDLVEVRLKTKDDRSADECRATFEARIASRPRLMQVAKDCTYVDNVIPVSVLLRAELDGSPHNGLASQLDAQFKDQLSSANIRIVSLAGFEREFQELVRYEQCEITGEANDDFRERCLKQDEDYAAARDAVIRKMRDEFQAYPQDFDSWSNCGGLMVLGQYSANGQGFDVVSNLEIDFASASDWQNEVPPKLVFPMTGPFDFSVEETARSQLSISVGNLGGGAIQKISNFINSHGCTNESTDS